MKATVKQNKHGLWYARPYLGTSPDGSRIRPYKTFPDACSEEEAQEAADEWLKRYTIDGQAASGIITDLLWSYIDTRAAKGLAPNTIKRWKLYTRSYVDPYLGGKLAAEITAKELDDFEKRLCVSKERGGKALSVNTVIGVHYFLRGAYRYWVRLGLCKANPMLGVVKPKASKRESVSVDDEWDLMSLSKALKACFETSEPFDKRAVYAFGAWLALVTGTRVGEVCALRRRDVRFAIKEVYVGGTIVEVCGGGLYRSPVTKNGKTRSVAVTAKELAIIKRFASKQAACNAGLTSDSALVSLDGSFIRPTTLSRAFSRLRDELKIPKACTFHSLRHTHATWALASGVDLKTLSRRLGHADEATTLRLYAHLLPGNDAAAAQAFEDLLEKLEEEV